MGKNEQVDLIKSEQIKELIEDRDKEKIVQVSLSELVAYANEKVLNESLKRLSIRIGPSRIGL